MHFFIEVCNIVVSVVTVLYLYQMLYIVIVFVYDILRKACKVKEKSVEVVPHNLAVIICARNEEMVIDKLLETINNQSYPKDKLKAVVIADNCTDKTAEIARRYGAVVFERFNTKKVGKGYALNFAFKNIYSMFGESYFDGYIIIDADNLLDSNYVAEMNKTFCQGYRVITSYRNSKNYGTNWITAGYAVAFMREAKFLNYARSALGSSCAVSGTGFLVSNEIIRERGGWNYSLLTEDIEFTVDTIMRGETIGYCENAMLYDEQPTTFRQSWHQRVRWSRGFYQIVGKYGKTMLASVFRNKNKNRFSCFDITLTVMPTVLITVVMLVMQVVVLTFSVFQPSLTPSIAHEVADFLLRWVILYYGSLFFMGAVTVITEWKKIKCPIYKRILYMLTYPLFMMTYIPISIAAMFGKVEWKPIEHSVSKTLDEVTENI